jgi:hypothetical protein
MTNQNKAAYVRWAAVALGLIFLFVLVQSALLMLVNGEPDAKNGFIQMLFLPIAPLVIALTLLGTIYCAILVVNPRKLPVFDPKPEEESPPGSHGG